MDSKFVLQRKIYTAASDIFGHLRGDDAIGGLFRLAAKSALQPVIYSVAQFAVSMKPREKLA